MMSSAVGPHGSLARYILILMLIDFDEADFSVDHDPDPDSHPDEVALPASVTSNSISVSRLNNFDTLGIDLIPNNPHPIKSRSSADHAQIQPPRAPTGNHALDVKGERNEPQHCSPQNQPQTPNAGFARSSSGATTFAQTKPQDTNPTRAIQALTTGPRRPPNQPNQPNRTGVPCALVSQAPPQNPLLNNEWEGIDPALPQNIGSNAFFSARAAALLLDVNDSEKPPSVPGILPLFNPHAESPSIRKTPGVDHNRSKPLNRELKHVSGSAQSMNAAAPIIRANIVNPQLDAARKIGAPGISSPMANRGMYKPPTMKRLNDGSNTTTRPPLGDKPANGSVSIASGGTDAKRQKLNGP
jgi:DNA repair and recombination protein RAD52